MRLKHFLLFVSCGWLAAGCSNNEQTQPPANVTPSTRGNLRFKGPERLTNDYAAALELPTDGVCTELGQYQCTTAVHTVALGGVDPYGTGLYEATGITSSTTPLVVERVAWSACIKRVETDLATPASAVLFRGVPLDGAKLANPDGDEVRGVIAQLMQRAYQRDPYPNETARYIQLARDIESTGTAEPARTWMQSVCFAVLSSAEAVFY